MSFDLASDGKVHARLHGRGIGRQLWGSPMQRVSGVTGATRLWNRIMRHRAERETPATFAPPCGHIHRPTFATTGVRAARDCERVDGEWR